MNINKSGFFFDGTNEYHLIDENDINNLIELNISQKEWQKNNREYSKYRDNPNNKYDPLIDEIYFMNLGGG